LLSGIVPQRKPMTDVTFNPEELATYEEARAIRDLLNSDTRFAGAQILMGDDENGATPQVNPNFPWLPPIVPQLGIHRLVWEGGPGGFQEPGISNAKFLHFRFSNGFDGMNVGLVRQKFKAYMLAGPAGASYVMDQLAAEVRQRG
jgi:hypothetical protein